MVKTVLISCVSKKLDHSAKARDMYISPLFKLSLKYAQKLNPDKIFILSAKYHLLPIESPFKGSSTCFNLSLINFA